uniref:Uncharacterized protein n=2 Tax=Ditylenchus dipsaci TaxID=166011 RepID=A0A915DF16_9BILA
MQEDDNESVPEEFEDTADESVELIFGEGSDENVRLEIFMSNVFSKRLSCFAHNLQDVIGDFMKTLAQNNGFRAMLGLLKRVKFWLDDVEVLANQFGIKLNKEQLGFLEPTVWLNGKTVNFYHQMIVQQNKSDLNLPPVFSFDSLFYTQLQEKGPNAVLNWSGLMSRLSWQRLVDEFYGAARIFPAPSRRSSFEHESTGCSREVKAAFSTDRSREMLLAVSTESLDFQPLPEVFAPNLSSRGPVSLSVSASSFSSSFPFSASSLSSRIPVLVPASRSRFHSRMKVCNSIARPASRVVLYTSSMKSRLADQGSSVQGKKAV